MADTLTLPGVGKVDRKWVYVGGAAAAGMLGYAWLTRGSGELDDLEAAELGAYDALGFPLDDGTEVYTPPNIVPGTGSGSDDVSDQINTNDDWAEKAIDLLYRYGADPLAAASALGKFLLRQPLTPAEADLVRQAMAVAGPPPTGGPWTITPQTNGAATALPAPSGLSGAPSSTYITWSWQPVTGAQGYDVELVEGLSTVTERATITATTWRPRKTLTPGRPYRINLYARNSAGQRGARATLVTTTSSAPTASTMTVTGLRVEGSNSQDITWRWNPTPGARSYYVELIAGTNTVIRRGETSTPRYRAGGGLQRRRSYRARVRARDSAGRLGPDANKNGRTK